MKYRIEKREPIRLVGLKYFISPASGDPRKTIPNLWYDLTIGKYIELRQLSDGVPDAVVGLFADKHDGGFDYWIAAVTTKECPENFDTIVIPSSTWAVFEIVGPIPDAVQETFRLIYDEWFPSCEYARIQIPEIEWFSDGDLKSDGFYSEA